MPTTTITYTPNVKVLDCIEYTLKQITNANGFITDGVVVDRLNDPRNLKQNVANEFRKNPTLVRLKLGNWKKDHSGEINSIRKIQTLELICRQTLTTAQDTAGIDCEMLKDWLRHDVEWALRRDNLLRTAAAAVKAEKLAEGIDWGDAPGMINLEMTDGMVGSIITHPDVYQTLTLQWRYNEWPATGSPAFTGTP
jgi:hypothetical protein